RKFTSALILLAIMCVLFIAVFSYYLKQIALTKRYTTFYGTKSGSPQMHHDSTQHFSFRLCL
ncbi:hypothetical protein M1N48_00945, partial [Dehalococcoidia bacterium]|nr:hypothetical protein [Dehalococcoidia bacterium]